MISVKKFSSLDASIYRKGFSVVKNMSMFSELILSHCWSPIVWKDNAALTANFLSSDFLALDFDTPGEETLEQINHSLQDHKRLIATTKSHQISKNGIVCDRFRLIIPFTETITDYRTYRQTYLDALKKYPWADRSCLDGARFFFPSKTIIVVDRESDYRWKVSPYVERIEVERVVKRGVIPNWCLEIINNGLILEGSRNVTLFRVACGIFEAGFSEGDVRRFLMKMKIDFKGVNLEAALKSAQKKIGGK
jgi:hypothetical protein